MFNLSNFITHRNSSNHHFHIKFVTYANAKQLMCCTEQEKSFLQRMTKNQLHTI